jgi:tetratricopeptide (TPR) repeat protein
MAKIPLRTYTKEIENLIERGEIEQAISHARNILKSYPKHIDTYRLLGKAFLESQRYSEAADILQRVLSVLPDDFISQIGMSIIREDEGNLDAAIWHMERAYEVQPFNPAVQDELRRLYGRRDGIEPPKIRLTRGALVRMYTRGELYPQAIAETRAALAEDPQRQDLLVLLARLYYLSDHKNDAAEVCSELIRKLPYCYEANHLLAEFLPSTNRAEEAQKFQQRIFALDPYAAFIAPTIPTSDQVPDQAVMVEQFTWDAAMGETKTPEWTRSVGVEWEETAEEALPDWLNTLKPESPATQVSTPATGVSSPATGVSSPATGVSSPATGVSSPATGVSSPDSSLSELLAANQLDSRTEEEKPAPRGSGPTAEANGAEVQQEDIFPDWMKEAGWVPSDRKADEIMAGQVETESDEIAPAELPDWIQSIVPHETGAPAEEAERTDWLETILSQPGGTNGKEIATTPPATIDEPNLDNLPDWISGAGTGTQAPPPSETASDELPDWFAQIEEEQAPNSTPTDAGKPIEFEGLPDWSQLGEPSTTEPTPGISDTPDWLRSFEPQAPETTPSVDQTPDWLQSFGVDTPDETKEPAEFTDWLKPTQLEHVEADEVVAAAAAAAAVAGAEAGAEPADAPLEGEAPATEMLPDWLQAEEAAAGTEAPTLEEKTADVQPTAPDLPDVVPSMSDMDSAMAWLELLAAKQGADEATLVTSPEQRTEQPPEWVAKEMESQDLDLTQAEADATFQLPDLAEEPAQPDEISSTLPDWLQAGGMEPPNELPEETIASMPAAETPDLVEPAAPDLQNIGLAMSDMDAAMAWQESLAAKQGADEATLVTPPEQRLETPPEWVAREMETPPAPQEAAEGPSEVMPVSEPVSEEPGLPEPPVSEGMDWLKQEEAIQPTELVESAPDGFEAPVQPEAQPAVPDFQDFSAAMSDTDAAMAWLESLAAKQGADEATLVTSPEQRTEQPPEWVAKEMESQEQNTESITGETPAAEELQPAEEAVFPDWLQEAIAEEALEMPEAYTPPAEIAAAAETPVEEPAIEKLPEAGPVADEVPAAEVPAAEAAIETSSVEMDLDSAFAWLEALAAKQGADEATLVNAPEARLETPPEWVQQEQADQAVEEEPQAGDGLSVETLIADQPETEGQPEVEILSVADQPAAVLQAEEEQPAVAAEIPAWLQDIQSELATKEAQQTTIDRQTEEEIPAWLANIGQEEPVQTPEIEDIAPWPMEEETASEEPVANGPAPDWIQEAPAETAPYDEPVAPAEIESAPDWLKDLEAEAVPANEEVQAPPLPGEFRSAWEPEVEYSQPPAKQQPVAPQPALSAQSLTDVQNALNRGHLDQALEGYNLLIQNGQHLDETIHDLRDALYRYPIDINIWQTLGDAYAHNNQLQEALDAYTKAEELLR